MSSQEEISLPVLYKLDKSNRPRYWECRVKGYIFETRSGVLKNREVHPWYQHDRLNYGTYSQEHGSYRTPEQIAKEHAQSLWLVKKRNDAMTESLEELMNPSMRKYSIPIAPVLAVRYSKLKERHEKSVKRVSEGKKLPITMYMFPDKEFYVDPKLDGERATISFCVEYKQVEGNTTTSSTIPSEPTVHIFSRARIEIPHLEPHRALLTKIFHAWGKKFPEMYGYTFDGEIVEPGNTRNKMRSTISRIKEKHADNDNICIYIFDIVTRPDMPYSERRKVLDTIFSKVNSKYVKLVRPLGKVKPVDEKNVNELMALSLNQGYEGIILRDPNMLYPLSNLRIDQMIKMKPQNTREYRIISAIEGIDKFAGCITFVCQDLNDGLIQFSPGMKGWTHEERKEAWRIYQETPEFFIGKLLEVTYVSLSEYSVPVEGIATRIRDPNDLSTPAPDHSSKFGSRRSYGEDDDDDFDQ